MTSRSFVGLLSSIILLTAISCINGGRVAIYPAPDEAAEFPGYEVHVNNRPVCVYQARVSARPINQIWPEHQRSKDQTELAGFSYFNMTGPVQVKVEITDKEKHSVNIRPKSYVIDPTIRGNMISFQNDLVRIWKQNPVSDKLCIPMKRTLPRHILYA